jgi:PAS domain S-box-containing protein
METKSLRNKAETELQQKIESLAPEVLSDQSIEDLKAQMEHLLHEVQVYEQELEIQNQELRETQAALEKSRDRYAELFDFAPTGYVTLNDRGVIKDINLAAAGLLGRDRRRLIGFPFVHFVASDDQLAFLTHLTRCKRHGEGNKVITELLLKIPGKIALPVQLYSVAARSEAEAFEGLFRTALTDISERRQAEAEVLRAQRELERRVEERTMELREANELLMAEVEHRERLEYELRRRMRELAKADRHKDEFLAMLSHELRNPLAAIANAGEVLGRQTNGQEGVLGRITRIIKSQAAHLQHLLDDLLDVARVTRGKIVLHRDIVELSAVVNQAVETHRALIERRSQRLAVTLPPEPVYVDADATRLVQIVGNLLHNAAKFTEPGGEIVLTAEREDGEAVIRVRDNGAGIAPELLGHVFDLFTQEDRSLARSSGGLGIGLALVRKLTEMHGGRVEAASPGAGQGSEFTVRLPVANRPAAAVGDCGEPDRDEPGCGECPAI